MTTTTSKTHSRKLLLHACPRCQGDLLYDAQEEEFACMQCSRRISVERLAEAQDAVLATAA